MDFFGCRDEDRWGDALQAGGLLQSGETEQEERRWKKMLSIDCFLCQRGIVGLPADIWMSPE